MARLGRPGGAAALELGVVDQHVDPLRVGVDADEVAVLTSASGPPSAASGAIWPMHMPRVAPEKRPSVMSATFSPICWP